MKLFSFSLLAWIISVSAFSQSTFIPTFSLHPSAKSMAFSYQGDIWEMDLETGINKRLTLHEAYEGKPFYHPDGNSIAFNSNRFGSNDVFTVSTDGGVPTRLNYHSANDNISDWANNGTIIFSTSRVFKQVEWDGEIYSIPENGGTPQRILNAVGDMASLSADGRYLAFVRGACRESRENYVGPANNEIWIYDYQEETFTQITNNEVNDIYPKWSGNRLYFLSAVQGRYALLSTNIYDSDKDPDKIHYSYINEGIRYYDVKGDWVLFARADKLYKAKIGDNPEEIKVNIPTDYRFYPTEKVSLTSGLSAYAISPDGNTLALEQDGEVFVKELDKEKSYTVNLSNHAYQDINPRWLNDSTLLFTSDREDDKYSLYKVQSTDAKKASLVKTIKREVSKLKSFEGDLKDFSISPNKKKVIYSIDNTKVVVADLDETGKLSNTKTLMDSWHGANRIKWSPDSRYIAYSHQDLSFNNEVYIRDIEGGDEVNVSMHPGSDYGPVWSADGGKLGFISDRNGQDADLWFVWLKEEDWLKSKEELEEGYYFDQEEKEEKPKKKKKDDEDAKKKDEEVEPIQIDFDNIYDRLVQVTRLSGSEGNLLISKDGETFYFTSYSAPDKGSFVYSIKYDGSDMEKITKSPASYYAFTWDDKHKGVYCISRGKLNYLDFGKGKPESYPYKAKYTLNKVEQRKQVFDEACKILARRFYDPNYHGEDWKELQNYYRPIALAASTDQDFRYVFNLMLGRLNASHMGLYGGSEEDVQNESTGRLGLELIPVKGGVQITRVVERSPATRFKNKLEVGDIITAVNGENLSSEINFYQMLEGTLNDQVLLEVKNNSGEKRELVIRPGSSISTYLYEEWVKERKALTEKYSNGKLGYVHIKGMDMWSFERFERELMASGYGKEGIVIDVRFNGGGWTTDYLLAVLSVRQHAYTIPRGATDNLDKNHTSFSDYYPYSERLPLSGWTKPSVALCNESSYSNAEIFSHAYKHLGIGTLVGQPTFGAVISTSGTGLADGSFLRLPFRGWYVKATGENMENGPAVPQVLVENQPDSKVKGEDPQLKKAVEVLLKQLED